MTGDSVDGGAVQAGSGSGDGPRELSRAAAVGATVLAVLCGCAVMLAFLNWLGWSIPLIGVLVAKAGIKLAVAGFAGLAAAFAWLRTRLGRR
ncbi:hypothetical protein [Streptomyces sp. NRRL WC-3742]|uniref:hypothetical protein n=1 Tax=Streptomyces sp. NRRL WC-3742 TaxID=1463934 RepID=UPI00131AD168|nr:hypothetical protein [Streptomyces sp. NRRL WC-3742]